jgi:hypothetical protein
MEDMRRVHEKMIPTLRCRMFGDMAEIRDGAAIMTERAESAGARQGGAAAPNPGGEASIALIEQRLGHTLGPQQRAAVAEVLGWIADAWERQQCSVPTGTEPDFVFQPTPLAPDRCS